MNAAELEAIRQQLSDAGFEFAWRQLKPRQSAKVKAKTPEELAAIKERQQPRLEKMQRWSQWGNGHGGRKKW